MRRKPAALLAAALLLTATACATPQGPGTALPRAGGGTYQAVGTVLESPEHGPELCNAVATSYPPQCGGIELANWDWDAVEGEESANGTTWGEYLVTGTWDGVRLTITEPPAPPERAPNPDGEPDFSTPCAEPAGGWAVVDPAKATQQAFDDTVAAANARPDFAGLWIDQPIHGSLTEETANDPTNLVLNVRVTGDVAAAERDLRQLWGGALCVTAAERTEAELLAIQAEITEDWETIGMTSSYVDSVTGIVAVEVVLDEGGALQAQYDERYGPGVVFVTSWLRPVAPA